MSRKVCVPSATGLFLSSTHPCRCGKDEKMPQRYVKINHELIPVTEEVYLAYNRPKEKERFMARRDGKCRQEDYRICSGDCAACPWQQEGHRMMSLHKVLGSECEKETPAMDSNTPIFQSRVRISRLALTRTVLAIRAWYLATPLMKHRRCCPSPLCWRRRALNC